MNLKTLPTNTLTLHIILISLVLIVCQAFQSELIFQRQAIAEGEIWRIVTGNWVHTNIPHLIMNIVGLWLLWMLFNETLKPFMFYLSLFITNISIGLALLLLNPELFWYAGLSGSLYGLYIIGASIALMHKDYIGSIPLFIIIPTKLVMDLTQNDLTGFSEKLINAPVSTEAHMYGVIAALAISITLFITCIMKLPSPKKTQRAKKNFIINSTTIYAPFNYPIVFYAAHNTTILILTNCYVKTAMIACLLLSITAINVVGFYPTPNLIAVVTV